MIFKTSTTKNGMNIFSPNWTIIDGIKKAEYNNIASKTCFLVVESLSETSVGGKGFSLFKNDGLEDNQLLIDECCDLWIDYNYYLQKEVGCKFYLNWINITLESGSEVFIIFDKDGYLLNDNGKTVEIIRCY